jgi:hypothetical protein
MFGVRERSERGGFEERLLMLSNEQQQALCLWFGSYGGSVIIEPS